MKTPNERLKEMRIRRGFKEARDAARAYGWNVHTYASHENGNRGIPPDSAIQYAMAYRFSLDWLYKGRDPIKTVGLNTKPGLAFKVLPRLRWDFLKLHGGLKQAMEQATDFTSLPQDLEIELPAFTMAVNDDSMMSPSGHGPSFESNETLIFSTKRPVRPGNFVIAELLDENVVTFRQYRERGRNEYGFMTFELAPINPAYPTRLITGEEQARIVAVLSQSIKSY